MSSEVGGWEIIIRGCKIGKGVLDYGRVDMIEGVQIYWGGQIRC